MRAALLFLLALPLAGCAGPGPATGGPLARACASPALAGNATGGPLAPAVEVAATTPDGVVLHGWRANGSAAHEVVLLHGLNEDHHSYDSLAQALEARGFTTLAWDLRGHGASATRNGQPYELQNFTDADIARMQDDLALEVAGDAPPPPCLAVVGASVGANLALRAKVAFPVVDAVALLSPGHDYHGITTDDVAPKYGPGPIFLAASAGDGYAAETVQSFQTAFRGATTLVLPSKAAHGTNLLREDDVQQRLADWLAAVD